MKFSGFLLLNILLVVMRGNTQNKIKINIDKKVNIAFIKFNDSIYISNEITNMQYNSFLKEYKNTQNTIPYYLMIDSTKWMEIPMAKSLATDGNLSPYVELYHTHQAYKDYPVVNIVQRAAVEFCNFLNKKYSSKGYKFTLPTSELWTYINYIDNTYCQSFDMSSLNGGVLTGSTKGNCNHLISHLLDNVSEFTSDSNIVMGGNWYEGVSNLSYKNTAPKPYIGFRVILINRKSK